MSACDKHASVPAIGISACPGCEIEQLRKELESHKRMLLAAACDIGSIGEALGAGMDDDGSEIEGLAQELRKDAERYRWLRDSSESIHQFHLSTPIWFKGVKFSRENVDSAIDAAMAKESK